MKSFNQFCSEAIYFIEMSDFSAGGGNAKMRQTGMTRDQVIALGQKNLARLKNRSAAPAQPAAPAQQPAASRPAPKKDERPTNRQVAAARKEAEYQRNARNLRLGAELGGVAKLSAQQRYSNMNSPAMRAAELKRQASVPNWKQHQFTQDSPAPNKPKDRDYGIPDFVSDRRRENLGAMTDANVDAGMSRADAAAKARRDEAQRHKRNMQYQKNRRYGYSG